MTTKKKPRYVYLDTSSWNKLLNFVQASLVNPTDMRERLATRRLLPYLSDVVVAELKNTVAEAPSCASALCDLATDFCETRVAKPVGTLVAEEIAKTGRTSARPNFLLPRREASQVSGELVKVSQQPAVMQREVQAVAEQIRNKKKEWVSFTTCARKVARAALLEFPRPQGFHDFASHVFGDKVLTRNLFHHLEEGIRLEQPDFCPEPNVPIRTSRSLCHFARFFLWLEWKGIYKGQKARPQDIFDNYHFAYACHADWFVTDDAGLEQAWRDAGRASTAVMKAEALLNRIGCQLVRSSSRGWHGHPKSARAPNRSPESSCSGRA